MSVSRKAVEGSGSVPDYRRLGTKGNTGSWVGAGKTAMKDNIAVIGEIEYGLYVR